MANNDGVITASESDALFALPPGSTRRDIHRGRLPGRKSGGVWLVNYSDAVRLYGQRKSKNEG